MSTTYRLEDLEIIFHVLKLTSAAAYHVEHDIERTRLHQHVENDLVRKKQHVPNKPSEVEERLEKPAAVCDLSGQCTNTSCAREW